MFSTEKFIRLHVRILWTQDHRGRVSCSESMPYTHPNIHKPNLRLVNVTYCSMEQEMDPEFEINRTSTRVRVVGAVIKVELKPHFVVLPSCRCILELYESIK